MSFSHFNSVRIRALASCVPAEIQKNIDYPLLFTEKEKKRLIKLTGIKERRIARNGICASDLGCFASEKLLSTLNFNKQDIKYLVFLSQTPDYRIPFTANILQDRLQLGADCACLDINAGCSGFISGLNTAFAIQSSLSEGNVLFVVAETMSKLLSKKDRGTSLLFGDGASAVLLEKTQSESNSYFSSYSDGGKFDVISIPDSGYRNPVNMNSFDIIADSEGNEKNSLHLNMDGPAVFDFTMKEVIPSMEEIFEFSGINPDEINYFAFHQSNKFIIQQFVNKLGLDSNKVPINIDRFGNTSGVSIPLVITTELGITNGDKVTHCVGYGAGLSWGNCILDLSKTEILPLFEFKG